MTVMRRQVDFRCIGILPSKPHSTVDNCRAEHCDYNKTENWALVQNAALATKLLRC